MIKRETLYGIRSASKKMDFRPDRALIQTLVNANLELLDVIDGGNTHITLEREIKSALTDLQASLDAAQLRVGTYSNLVDRARYVAAMMSAMVGTKPDRRKPWSHYQAMVAEEYE